MNCPHCHREMDDLEPVDMREVVNVRGRKYTVKTVKRLSPHKGGGYKYRRAVRLVELEPKKEG